MLKYDLGKQDDKNWVICETMFDSKYLAKCETIMSTGNGYLGLRSAHEETYSNEVKNLFVNGTFNKAYDNEVTELPNGADVTTMNFEINGEIFSLEKGKIVDYKRELHIKSGEVIRKILWVSPIGDRVEFVFRRFVSLDNLHIIGQRVEIKADNNMNIKLLSGIDGTVSNSGSQHFLEGEKRLFDNEYLQLNQITNKTGIDFVLNTRHTFYLNENLCNPETSLLKIERRKIYFEYDITVNQGEKLIIEKISNVYTSRDKEIETTEHKIKSYALAELKRYAVKGYDNLFDSSKKKWQQVWDNYDIVICSNNDFDQLAIRFAIYHLILMTPKHDCRMGIGAKGLTGEGYKGHTFWDTEIFILPFWIYNNTKVAKNLLIYRYLTLKGAHKKAKENGYIGAQFPWESAWLEDGEVTPKWGEIDVISGKQDRVLTGLKEIHVTADIAYAVWHYFMVTKDKSFMDDYGYELIFDTAVFWQSRLKWDEISKKYQILDIIGPDEYKIGVNNNAYTNYLVYWNIKLAIKYYEELKVNNSDIYNKLNKKLYLDDIYKIWIEKVDNIFLQEPGKDGVIPQDDSYLSLPCIDLSEYKKQSKVQSIFKDYNMKQICGMQISKQADLLVLLYLFGNLYGKEIVKKNFDYYEKRCLHDSSLSLCIHSIIACDLDDSVLAYKFFEDATKIDLGTNMNSSDAGIHTASIGGVWQCVINGFAGVRMNEGQLQINPQLPKSWEKMIFNIMWSGDKLHILINKDKIHITNETNKNREIRLICNNKEHVLENKLIINI